MAKLRHEADDPGQESGLLEACEARRPPDPIDGDGVPTIEPVVGWLDLFGSSDPIDPRASRRLQVILRFCRPDGSSVFGPGGRSMARLRRLEAWSLRLGDPSLAAVVARWLPARSNAPFSASPLPSPIYSNADRPLAAFRTDWGVGADLAAIDHRRPGDETLLEVASRGRNWVGPSWTSGPGVGHATRATPTRHSWNPFADHTEWTYKAGSRRVTRCVVLIRGRSMALLGQQDDGGGGSSEVRIDLGDGVEAHAIEGSRALLLSSGRGRATARLLPLGLPAHDRPTDLGSIAVEGRQVVIRGGGEGRRRWLPILICWGKAPTTWRLLTVAQRSKTCRGDVAAAVRVAWGPRDEGLVVYRSLATPKLRSFVGHQTGARFLVGAFTRAGEVRPILKVDP